MRFGQSHQLTFFFTAVWTGLLGGSLYLLWSLDHAQTSEVGDGERIAQVTAVSGEVQFRGDDDMVWVTAQKGRGLEEGNHLATGDIGEAHVLFVDGRSLVLGAHTRVVLSEEIQDGETTSVVTLISGSLRALPAPESVVKLSTKSAAKKTAAPLVVRSGGQSLPLKTANQVVQITKPKTGPLEVERRTVAPPPKSLLERLASTPLLSPALSHVLAPLKAPAPVPAVAAAPLPPAPSPASTAGSSADPLPASPPVPLPALAAAMPQPASPPVPPLNTDGLNSVLGAPLPSRMLWTTASFQDREAATYPVTLIPPQALPNGVAWTPYLRLNTRSGSGGLVVEGQVGTGPQTLRIPLAKLIQAGTWTASVRLTVGAKLQRGSDAAVSVEKGGPILSFGSLGDLAEVGPLQLALHLGNSDAASSWNTRWTALGPSGEGAPLTLYLSNSHDVSRLLPLLGRAVGFTVSRASRLLSAPGAAAFVRNNHIIAVAAGTAVSGGTGSLLAGELARLLAAPLVFRGSPTAFIGQPGEPNYLARLASRDVSQKRIVVYDHRYGAASYVMVGRTLTGNGEIADYVNGALGIFTEPVELIPVQVAAQAH